MAEFWLIVALVLLIVIVRKPAQKALIGGLDGRAERIRTELDEAKKLHHEAKKLLEEQKQALADGEKHIAGIMQQARSEADRMTERMRTEFGAVAQRRKVQAEERIAQEQDRALSEVRERVAHLATSTARALIVDRVDGPVGDKLTNNAISEIGRKLA